MGDYDQNAHFEGWQTNPFTEPHIGNDLAAELRRTLDLASPAVTETTASSFHSGISHVLGFAEVNTHEPAQSSPNNPTPTNQHEEYTTTNSPYDSSESAKQPGTIPDETLNKELVRASSSESHVQKPIAILPPHSSPSEERKEEAKILDNIVKPNLELLQNEPTTSNHINDKITVNNNNTHDKDKDNNDNDKTSNDTNNESAISNTDGSLINDAIEVSDLLYYYHL